MQADVGSRLKRQYLTQVHGDGMTPDVPVVFLNVLGGGCMFFAALEVVATAKAGSLSARSIRRTARIALAGGKVMILACAILLLIQPLTFPGFFPPLLSPGLSFILFNRVLLPPSLLFLGSSDPQAFTLFSMINENIKPLKTVHLLDHLKAGYAVGEALRQDGNRVGDDWQRAVTALMTVTPLIVIDARNVTRNLFAEISYAIGAGLQDRVFLVASSRDSLWTIEQLCLRRKVRLRVVTPEQLAGAIARFGWSVMFRRVGTLARHLESTIESSAIRRRGQIKLG